MLFRKGDSSGSTITTQGDLARKVLAKSSDPSYSLSSIVVELTPLRSFGDTRHGGQVDDVSRLAGPTYGFGRSEEREESECGKMV